MSDLRAARRKFAATPRAFSGIVATLVVVASAALVPVGAGFAQSARVQPPLAPFAAQRVIVLPVQLLRADSGAFVTGALWGAFRKELDDSIGAAIASRGIGRGWGYAADVARWAKRNSAYVGDPYALGAQLLLGVPIKPEDKVPELINSNLRSFIALGDTRYALVPILCRFERRGDQQWGVLRLALIDGRNGSFVWIGEVASDPAATLTPALGASLAARVADLVVAR